MTSQILKANGELIPVVVALSAASEEFHSLVSSLFLDYKKSGITIVNSPKSSSEILKIYEPLKIETESKTIFTLKIQIHTFDSNEDLKVCFPGGLDAGIKHIFTSSFRDFNQFNLVEEDSKNIPLFDENLAIEGVKIEVSKKVLFESSPKNGHGETRLQNSLRMLIYSLAGFLKA